MLFLWCKAEFSSLLQFSVSHDLLEIITIYLTLKKHFWLLSMLKTILLLHILSGNGNTLYFSGFFDNVKFNEQHLFAFVKYVNKFFNAFNK